MKTIQLKDILSISGKGGLYKFVAQARNGIVVESIEDQKRHVAPATARVSSLEEIAIFTREEEVPLSDVFFKIHETSEGKESLSHKASAAELKAFFEELLPDYDEDRVYISDIKKVFQWYNQLQRHDLLEVVDKEEEGADSKSSAEDSAPEKSTPEKSAPEKSAPGKSTGVKNAPKKGAPKVSAPKKSNP
jgi:ribosomal protein L24